MRTIHAKAGKASGTFGQGTQGFQLQLRGSGEGGQAEGRKQAGGGAEQRNLVHELGAALKAPRRAVK